MNIRANVRVAGSAQPKEIISVARPKVESLRRVTHTVLEAPVVEEPPSELLREDQQILPPQLLSKRTDSARLLGYFLVAIGLVAVVLSVLFTSMISAFVGLGLTFWGALIFFVQPRKYVRSDLMSATAISSLKTIDKMMVGMGYRERGVYIPGDKQPVLFVPSEPFSKIPVDSAIEDKTFLDDPQGLLVAPPGLALASLIEKKLGFKLKNRGINSVVQALPKVLVDDLEIVRDVEIEVTGSKIDFKFIDSIYADFCREIQGTSRRCGLGCPMCSALACILATASGKPVLFEEDKPTAGKNTTISSYLLVDGLRL